MRKRILPIIAAASIIAGGYGAHMMSSVNHNTKNVNVVNHVLLAQSHQTGTVCNLDGYPYLHMRSNGTTGAPIIKDLPSGTQVTVLGESGGWYKIQVNGVTGWVYSNYLSVNGNVGQQSSAVQSGYANKVGTVCNLNGYPYLHMRSNGTTGAPIIKDLTSGTQVKVLGEAGGWYKIESNGVIGWVYSNYLSVGNGTVSNNQTSNNQTSNNQVSNNQTSNNQVSGTVGTVCNLNGYPYLHMRSNGTTAAPIIKDLPSGTQVKVLGESGGWYNIQVNGVTGWVYSNYLSVNGNVGQQSSAVQSGFANKVGTVCNLNGYPYLHMRSNGTTGAPIIKDLTSGTQVKVLGEAGGWYKIQSNGVIGWVYSNYLSVGNGTVSNNQTSSNQVSNTKTTYATVGNLNGYPELHIRAAATVNSKQIGYLTNGYIVQVLQNMNNGWYKVKCQNGLIGYVDGYYLNF